MDMMYDDDDMQEDEGQEEEDEGGEVAIENEYDNAKGIVSCPFRLEFCTGLIEDDPDEAIKLFEKVVSMETEKGDWGFKALKKLTKLYFQKGKRPKVVEKFKQFMEYSKSAVTSNVSEKGLNAVLDYVGGGKDLSLTEELYNIALAALKKHNNEVNTHFFFYSLRNKILSF